MIALCSPFMLDKTTESFEDILKKFSVSLEVSKSVPQSNYCNIWMPVWKVRCSLPMNNRGYVF